MKTNILIFCLAILFTCNSFATQNAEQDNIEKIGRYIEASVENDNPFYINQIFDHDLFFNIFIKKNNRPSEFNENFESELEKLLSPGNLILNQIGSNKSYKFINSYTLDTAEILVFRSHSNEGLDYHEFSILRKEDSYKIIDIYAYYNGMRLSEKINTIYNISYQSMYTNELNKKTASKTKNIEQKVLAALVSNKYHKVIKQWENLDGQMKSEKKILLYTLRAASYVDTELTESIYNSINSLYPGTNEISLIVLEGLFEQQNYKLTLKYIDQLDKTVYTDPYLNYLRASIYQSMEQMEKAEWFLNKCIKELPEYEAGYFSLLEIYLNSSRYVDATNILTQLTMNFGFYKEELAPLLENYPEFANSEAYSIWIKD